MMITIDQIQKQVADYSFIGGLSLWNPKIACRLGRSYSDCPSGYEMVEIIITLQVPCVIDGLNRVVAFTRTDSMTILRTDEDIDRWIVNTVRTAVGHEFDESIRKSGKLVNDPHSNDHNFY